MNNEPVTVNKVTIESNMNYRGVPVLHYKIEYPQFIQPGYEKTLSEINRWYRKLAAELQYKYETAYYNYAVSQYEYTLANDFPFNMNEALSVYEITYNQNNIISLYYDHYLYAGGAHGNTVRHSETWNIKTGCRISLFQDVKDPILRKAEILEDIRKQIAAQEKKGENYYFEDYPQLIFDKFNPESFYYVPEGIIIYYQQYDIAPYSSGIPEFLIQA
jgi:hypothetical protein